MRRSDADHVRDVLEHVEVIHRYVAEGSWDQQILVDAVCLRLAASIERAAQLSDEARAAAFGGSWTAIWATRNRIAHGYSTVDPLIVRATVENDLDEYAGALRRVVGR
ncbi:HepT-like ribonuclease domain-containing protein [Cellulosimicrobium sp. Marseille-Q8652]